MSGAEKHVATNEQLPAVITIHTARVLLLILSAAVAAVWLSCRLPSTSDDPSNVSSLRFSPSAFDSFSRNTEIRYTLKAPSTISIQIVRRDLSGQLQPVNTLVENVYETRGSHAHTWLGDTRSGFFAPSGLYLGILQVGDQQYEASVRVFHF